MSNHWSFKTKSSDPFVKPCDSAWHLGSSVCLVICSSRLLFYLPILSQAYPHLPTPSATIIIHKLDCSNNGLKNQQQHKLLGISKYTWRKQYNKCRYLLISISNYQLLGKPVPSTPPAWQIILEPPAHTVTFVCNIHSCIYIHTHTHTHMHLQESTSTLLTN